MIECPPLLALSDPRRASHADQWWRIARPFARLAERGVDARVCWLGAHGKPDISPEGRIVVIQRTAFMQSNHVTGEVTAQGWQVRAWVDGFREAGAVAVVAELDDDTLSDAYMDWLDASGGLEMVRRRRLLNEREAWRMTVAACDAVTVSTEPLADVVRRCTDRPVFVVPNAIDVPWFRERLMGRPEWHGERLTIGWAGGRRPDADLEPMAVAWGRIARRFPHVRFVVGGWQPDCIYREVDDLDRIVRVPWRDLDDWPPVMQVDIGCTPLADTPFNRCKSPIKLWEYALAGAAVVASPTVYMDEVAHGANGWLAETADEWEAMLALLIEDDWLRLNSAAGLRAHIGEHHRLDDSLKERAAAYREIAEGVGVTIRC